MMHGKRRRVRRGFSLLEILIVVGILALLAAFVVPSLIGAQDSAKIDMARSAVGNNGVVAGALKRYRLDVGKYPDTDEGLEALFKRPSSIDQDSNKWRGPYMEGDPEELLQRLAGESERLLGQKIRCPAFIRLKSITLQRPAP